MPRPKKKGPEFRSSDIQNAKKMLRDYFQQKGGLEYMRNAQQPSMFQDTETGEYIARPQDFKGGGMLARRADRREARGMKLDQKAFDLRTGARDKKDRLIGRANRNYDRMRELRGKSYMALGGLVKKYQEGGLEGDPPMTAEELRALRNALLSGAVDEMPQAEDVVTAGQGSSTSVAMPGAPGEPLEPIRDPEPQRSQDPERPEDLEPLTPIGMRAIKTSSTRELQGGPTEIPRQYEDKFTSFTLDNSMRTERLPRAKEVYNPETRQYEERPLELEELADYIFRNQRKLKNLRYPTLEDAAAKAEEILSRPNAGRL